MMRQRCTSVIVFFIAVALAAATENYLDYGEETNESPAENIRELYKLLLQRDYLDNVGFAGVPMEHLMIRKSQRSPSLRLRFGRSGQGLSVPRPNVPAFNEN
ncbi:short neuropeptide F [Prorops nasuta]|uniref:short neuropeptide F n=1 Tax=Prorops nasuta TaxID=863751 RepID=UPI0034CEA7DE